MLGLIFANSHRENFGELGRNYNEFLLPFRHRPILVNNIEWLLAQNCREIIIIIRSDDNPQDFMEAMQHYHVSIEHIQLFTAEQVSSSKLDEIFDSRMENEPVLVVNNCMFIDDANSSQTFLRTENQEDMLVKGVNGDCGVYRFGNLHKCLTILLDGQPHEDLLKDMANVSQSQSNLNAVAFHDLNDYLTKKCLKKSRAVNSITITEDRVIKSSLDKKKMVDEYNWFNNLPPEIQAYTPKILDCDFFSKPDSASYTMERLKFRDITEMYLFSMLPLDVWNRIFRHAFDLLEVFAQYKSKRGSFMMSNYQKTLGRLATMPEHIKMNRALVEQFLHILEEVSREIDGQNDENVIHGDFYLGNILYDSDNDVIKVIDPKGSLFGSRYYDIAKIGKAVLYQYDYVDHELYSYDDQEEFYNFYDRGKDELKQLFWQKYMLKRYSERELYYIKVIIASLYLSMIPIHYHNPINQKLYYKIFENIFGEIKRDFDIK